MTLILGLVALNGAAAYADDVPASAASSTEQAQVRQFGTFFGGMASQYDLCVKKGLLPKGDQSAEQMAKSILEKMQQFNKGTDQTAFVEEGWDVMKREIAKHESEYTQEKCSWCGQGMGENGRHDDTEIARTRASDPVAGRVQGMHERPCQTENRLSVA